MPTKPDKPRVDFPLYAHSSGQWAKKIRGKLHYFGVWSKPQAALDEYHRFLNSGKTEAGDGLTMKRLVNSFLNSKKRLLDCDEIHQSTFQDYYDNCGRVLKIFGRNTLVESLRTIDFEELRADFAKTHGPVTFCGDISCTRVLFKYADDTFELRVRFGQAFRRTSRAVLRKHRQQCHRKIFQPAELRKVIKEAGVQLRAMIYLGINCGFGNNDCAMLPLSASGVGLSQRSGNERARNLIT